MTTTISPAIEMRGIEKSFGTNPVLKNVDFSVTVGEVHALAGENGAGKSTLMKILQGVYQKDVGEILVSGKVVEIEDTFAARRAGIGMVFQEFSLIPTLTVAQNIFLTNEPTRFGLIDDAKAKALALEIFKEMEVEVDPSRTVESMPTALWQLTEIAKALAQNAKVLIMDEPTAGMAPKERNELMALTKKLVVDTKLSVLFTEHSMDVVFAHADRIIVLARGRLIAQGNPAYIRSNPQVQEVYFGTGKTFEKKVSSDK